MRIATRQSLVESQSKNQRCPVSIVIVVVIIMNIVVIIVPIMIVIMIIVVPATAAADVSASQSQRQQPTANQGRAQKSEHAVSLKMLRRRLAKAIPPRLSPQQAEKPMVITGKESRL